MRSTLRAVLNTEGENFVRATAPWDKWREIGDRVFVRRHRTLDVNAGLVLGDDRCLVIDTRSSEREATELLRAVRSLTNLPYAIVNTHAHFDHCFGNGVFAKNQPDVEIWAHEKCLAELSHSGEQHRASIATWLRESGEEKLASEVEQVTLTLPNRTLTHEQVVDLGGRVTHLVHPGRGHSDHDLVVEIPDTDVTFVGDLVEQGAPPSFDDAFPLEWPDTLERLLSRLGPVVVPGHGDVVDPQFVDRQRIDIAEVASVAAKLPPEATDQDVEWAANRLAVGGPAGFLALRRAREHLAALTTDPA
jgi:glyoxylase-like metal-dependent hydrolase (beta-lactamase superfamily II)